MKISIIVPVYNSEDTLEKLVNSILIQKYNDYEVILVDDGSTDNTYKLMEKLSIKDNRIKIFTKKNEGPGLTRKYGYNQAEGELLFFMDSDDWLYDDNVLGKIVEIYNNDKFEVLFFDFIMLINGKEQINNAFNNNNLKSGKYSIDKIEKMLVTGALWKKIFLREKMKEEYFYDGTNYEDYYTTYMYLNECKEIQYVKEIFYVSNRDNPKSITKTKSIKKQIQSLEVIRQLYISTNFKINISLLVFDTYTSNWRRFKELINPNKESLILLYKLEEIKNIIKNLDKRNVTFKNIIKYYIINLAIYIGKRKIK